MPISSSIVHEAPHELKQESVPSHFDASTLPVEAMFPPARDRISVSLGLPKNSSKLVKMNYNKPTPKTRSKPLIKPVGWVSPNTWDSRNCGEIEGDYVDLLDFAKDTEAFDKPDSHPNSPGPISFKPVRPPPPIPAERSAHCGRTLRYAEQPCSPCSQRKLGHEPTDPELKCRYRDSYLAALRNPITFEKVSTDLLTALEEVGLFEEGQFGPKGTIVTQGNELQDSCDHCKEPTVCHEPHQNEQCCITTQGNSVSHLKQTSTSDVSGNSERDLPTVYKLTPGGSHSQDMQENLISQPTGHESIVHPIPDAPHPILETLDNNVKYQIVEVVKPLGKHKAKLRSLSAVSETSKGSPHLHKAGTRSHSDVCPEMIPSILQCKKTTALGLITPKLERWQSPKNESESGKSETPSTTAGLASKLQDVKRDKPSSPQAQLASLNSDVPLSPQSQESPFRSISGLLQLGIICLPGGRDKTGRAVVEVYADRKEWTSPLVSAQDVCKLLLYLHSIPRKDIRDLGMTLVLDARKKTPPPLLHKSLLMAQEQALHAVHSIVMLVDKDTCPRPERQHGLQMDVVTSLKALNKMVEGSQLTSELAGTFTYSHADWLQFHQRLVSFMTDLQGADGLLQRAIHKVDGNKKMDTAQDVQQCIQEQKALMKEVLEDSRLVTLQREGGAVLARMRREEFRFPQSEDYRDALESVTGLYNQVEEKVHTLVMRSNESLQHLEFLFRLREIEGKIHMDGTWFNIEGEQRLKASNPTDESLKSFEKALQHFDSFLKQVKEKKQHAMMLVTEAESILGMSDSSPTTDVFRTVVSTFKSNVDDFLLRAEQKHKELDTLVYFYRFCEQASALAKECCHYLEQVEKGCYPAKTFLSTLKMYEERLAGEFSTQRFQAVKAKACALGSGAMKMWNASQVQYQEVIQRLAERKKKKMNGVDKNQSQHATAAVSQGKSEVPGREVGKREIGEAGSSLTRETELDSISEALKESRDSGAMESTNVVFSNHLKSDLKESKDAITQQLHETTVKQENADLILVAPQNADCNFGVKWRPREHHSEADLRQVDSTSHGREFPLHQALGRSLSEGSCVSSPLSSTSGFSPFTMGLNHCRIGTHPLRLSLQTTAKNVLISGKESFISGHSCFESNKDNNSVKEDDPGQESFVPGHNLQDSSLQEGLFVNNAPAKHYDKILKLQKIIEELLSTEREYVRALGYVREHYFPELERADVPQDLRGQRGSIFGNLEKLHDFHHHHFLQELENCVKEPFRVGRCFLRHKDSFALYALYSKNKPQSDNLLISHGQSFFKEKQLQLGDKMDLWSYLLKPVQRISKYSLLLQDMVRECGPQQSKEMAEVQAALEVIHFQLRHGNNLLAMDDIHQCDVNLKEQGQLVRQDEFLVTFRKKKCFRHIFLFHDLILFSKTRKTDVGNDIYIYKQSFKTSDIGMTHNSGESGLCFEIWFRRRKSQDTYVLQAASRQVKEAWTKDLERILWDQAVHNREVRMQERVFMGIGNKPFMDIQPSDAAIHDRAVNYVLMGREGKVLGSMGASGTQGGPHAVRPNSDGSGSSSSSASSLSSCSSGRGSLSPMGYLCGPKQRGVSGCPGGYVPPPGVLEEDDLDHESGSQNLLLDSSESSGESVSGFSSSGHSYLSAVGGETEDTTSICTSTLTIKEAAPAHEVKPSTDFHKPNSPARASQRTAPPVAPKPLLNHTKDLSCSKAQNPIVGKSTEV
ncbi:quattro [Lampris incognitus]|uniref:quattro n=1 Tax=Lampris incognitus TaxID=2546036 RepID=UPI0024B4D5CC|nr:quattro [Lampris incognitus]